MLCTRIKCGPSTTATMGLADLAPVDRTNTRQQANLFNPSGL